MNTNNRVYITECPRDAMQGITTFIETEKKVKYLNHLLKVGFDVLDFGSFVSPKAIPQMADTAEVIKRLDLSVTKTKLLAIIANTRGAEDASVFSEINYLGFPFSISETFQKRNTNTTILESLKNIEAIQNICVKNGKQLLVYISMAFGNPYGDYWHPDIASEWIFKLKQLEIKDFALADTIGVSEPESITDLYKAVSNSFAELNFGMHLHSRTEKTREKVMAALKAGCRRIDSAIGGLGGCPMAKDDLTGNVDTAYVLDACKELEVKTTVDEKLFQEAVFLSTQTIPIS